MTDFDILEVHNRKAHFYAKGKAAHAAFLPIDAHGLNAGTATIADFQAGWRAAEHEQRQQLAHGPGTAAP